MWSPRSRWLVGVQGVGALECENLVELRESSRIGVRRDRADRIGQGGGIGADERATKEQVRIRRGAGQHE